ncbi:L-seryl-tRNA(Sec) selenium transferase [Desulfosarcina sp. OttesenSCG-928-G10]|nr:L-seryl-tRNA(Sec) selenium transferase [Desulfosarcina sp. OttesenSCG-928-G10]MDL2320871.1 L-seryl-tRNA(Sec) selenium transferase [Desulfosarcina sp. OttesenSCG-928-B08]
MNETRHLYLKQLPGVDRILAHGTAGQLFDAIPKSVLVPAIRAEIESLRQRILTATAPLSADIFSPEVIAAAVKQRADEKLQPRLRRTINATGVVVHTNLGRSLLSPAVLEHLSTLSTCYSNLEFDLQKGRRGSRYTAVEDILRELGGAEAAMVVNNNAAAVLLCLDTLAKGREVVVSRGELVEIGGSFRIPDVMEKSGAILKEVGTTNRTHPRDYEKAISENTALLLKVHQSNYHITGFTASVPLADLVDMGRQRQLPVMEDLGSGTWVDFSKYGLSKEPTIQGSVAAGADIVTFSGDKLLGGPQAGIILGRRDLIEQIRANPLTRALRIDKMTLAALEATLNLYRDEAVAIREIPTLRMLTLPLAVIQGRAADLKSRLEAIGNSALRIELLALSSKAGGGALPLLALPTQCLGITVAGMSADALEAWLRGYTPPIIGRIEDDRFIMDPRTLQEDEPDILVRAFSALIAEHVQNLADPDTKKQGK